MEKEKVNMDEYKEDLISRQGFVCPIANKYLDAEDAFIIYVNDTDYAVSQEGMEKLRAKYGKLYINDKIVHSMTIENQKVEREIG